jgi:hypothetical protein
MATKKRSTKGRRIGAAPRRKSSGKSDLMTEALGIIGGAIGAKVVTSLVKKQFPTLPPIVSGLVPVAGGVLLAGQKNAILRGAGYGMIGAGGAALAEAFIPGIGAPDDNVLFLGEPDDDDDGGVSYPASMSVLGEPASMSVLAGSEEDAEAMMLNGMDEEFDEY